MNKAKKMWKRCEILRKYYTRKFVSGKKISGKTESEILRKFFAFLTSKRNAKKFEIFGEKIFFAKKRDFPFSLETVRQTDKLTG